MSSWPFEASVPFEQEIVSGYELEIEETRNWLASSAAEEIFDEYNVQAAWKTRVGGAENLIGAIVSGLTDTSTPEGAILLPSMGGDGQFFLPSRRMPKTPMAACGQAETVCLDGNGPRLQ